VLSKILEIENIRLSSNEKKRRTNYNQWFEFFEKLYRYFLFLLKDISKATAISTCDIIETLASLNMIRMLEKDKLIIYRSQVIK